MATPHSDQLDPLSRLLSWITYRAAIAPEKTLLAALLITCAAIGLAVTRLEFRTSRLDLLSASAGYNQRWLAFLDKFGREDDAVVIVSHHDPAQVARALGELGQRLESDQQLHGVMYRRSMAGVADKALCLMPPAQLEQLDQLLLGCLQTLGGFAPPNAAGSISAMASQLSTMQERLASALTQAQLGLDRLKQAIPREGELLLEDEGRLGLCLLRVPHLDDEPIQAPLQLQTIQAHLAAMRLSYGDVEFGLTGMPVLEWDESQSSQSDMQKATLLSLFGVAIIFVFGFGSWRMPCAAVLCLAIGLIWTVGLATLLVGHLNLFSVAFGAIIAGLGIDYAIHLLARLHTQDRDATHDPSALNNFQSRDLSEQELPAALARAVSHCGKGIFTGAVTTAAAFAVAMLTPFRGMTELGVICAAGTLACMLVTIWVLPAVLTLQSRWLASDSRLGRLVGSARLGRPSYLGQLHHYFMQGLDWSNRSNIQWRVPVLLSTCCLTVMSGLQIGRLKYDHNLLNLQAENAPSVQAEHQLIGRTQHSAWFAVSMAKSAAHARALRQKLEKLPAVARVEEIGSLVAASQQPQSGPLVMACRQHATQLIEHITTAAARQIAAESPNSLMVLPASYNASAGLDPQVTSQLQLLSHTINELASKDSVTLQDFPSSMRSRMVSEDGQTYLLRIYARENLWQRENLGQFVKQLESVDPRVTVIRFKPGMRRRNWRTATIKPVSTLSWP